MGAAESHNPIRNMDKRTARRQYKDDFIKAIVAYRKEQAELNPSSDDLSTDLPVPSSDLLQKLQVCVRKRPIFKHEIANGEFDIVTCIGGKMVVAHDAKMHKDMRRQFMNHNEFKFDAVFKENAKNEDVYLYSAFPLVKNAIDGTFSTCLVYGQTGSGKTFTMSYIYERAAKDIFANLVDYPQASVSMSFLEIAGDNCYDLLNSFTPAQLLTGHDEGVYPYPVVEPIVQSAEELYAMIMHGCSLRATAATGVHGGSSRSHAILRIYIQKDGMDERRRDDTKEGVLTLVDLAGSEYGIDSMYHSAERRKEGAAINASLMALKECLRARAVGEVASRLYRNSKLTMALKSSFTLKNASTVIIATVSPASKDTEHTLSTLRHACIMDGQAPADGGGETRFLTGGVVRTVEVGEVNITAISRQNIAARKNGDKESINEPKTSNGNFSNDSAAPEMTEREKAKAQRIAERKAIARLSPAHLELLLEARNRLRNEPRQSWRLQRYSLQPAELLGDGSSSSSSSSRDPTNRGGEGKPKRPPRKSNPIKAEPWKDLVDDDDTQNTTAFDYPPITNYDNASIPATTITHTNLRNNNNSNHHHPYEAQTEEEEVVSSSSQYPLARNENTTTTSTTISNSNKNTPRGEDIIVPPPPDHLKRIKPEPNTTTTATTKASSTSSTSSSSLDSRKLTTSGKLKLLSTLLKQCQFHESHIDQILIAANSILNTTTTTTTSSSSPSKPSVAVNNSHMNEISKTEVKPPLSSDMLPLTEGEGEEDEEEDEEVAGGGGRGRGVIPSPRTMIRQPMSSNRQSTGSMKPATPPKPDRKSLNVRSKNNSNLVPPNSQNSSSNTHLHSPPSPLTRSHSIVQRKSNSQQSKETLSYNNAYQQLTPRQVNGGSGGGDYNSSNSNSNNIPLPPSPKVVIIPPRKRTTAAVGGSTGTTGASTHPPSQMQETELEKVMRELQSDALTDASRYGLQKRLAKLQAIQIREKKRVEQNQREEELKMRDESKGSPQAANPQITSTSRNIPQPSNSINGAQGRYSSSSFSEPVITNNGNISDYNNIRNRFPNNNNINNNNNNSNSNNYSNNNNNNNNSNSNNYSNNNNSNDYNDYERIDRNQNAKRSTANLLSDILDEPRAAASFSRNNNNGNDMSYVGANQEYSVGSRRPGRETVGGGVSTVAPFANEFNWENDLI